MNGYCIARDTDGKIVSGWHEALEDADRDCTTINAIAALHWGYLVRGMNHTDYLAEVWG